MLKQKSRVQQGVRAKAHGKAGQPAKQSSTGKKFKIKNKEVYDVVMQEIHTLMKKGEKNLSNNELLRLRSLAEAAEAFEDATDPLPSPASFGDIIKMKIYQLHLNQQFAARLLGVSEAKLSLIMNGKQKPDVIFLKAVYEKLKVDAHLILETV
jgi:HTH-type transcriptional regulator/antitoxin HigA